MSVNKYQPYLMILPEDDANREIANGFMLEIEQKQTGQIQLLPVAGGWQQVCNRFVSHYVTHLRNHLKGYMVLMVDFDSQSNRLSEVKECLPTELSNRVFVLGVWSEPESLTADLKQNKEQIGALLAIECLQDKRAIWNHELLKHNVPEIDRMPPELRALLFP